MLINLRESYLNPDIDRRAKNQLQLLIITARLYWNLWLSVVKILKDTSHYHSSSFADVDVVLLFKLLNSWPLSMIFPVIDILRMIILHPDGAAKLLKHINCVGGKYNSCL
ncbi:uncharacterized protein LOC141630133 [Silene latifolia]|uniref:uncharacterized protein LOC141630133 n=1 Tax=Silene latifolia TaxID=37657 RepID=UPI003D783243